MVVVSPRCPQLQPGYGSSGRTSNKICWALEQPSEPAYMYRQYATSASNTRAFRGLARLVVLMVFVRRPSPRCGMQRQPELISTSAMQAEKENRNTIALLN